MHFSSIFLHNPSKTLNHRLISLRWMGGGPRTFPDGLNKWQWKRMHEKKAREKEKRLLDQEKQVYQARVRSQIRSKLEPSEKPDKNQPNYEPLSPQDHVKALADRFMKEGAEDLWNEADGPLKIRATKSGKIGKPIGLEKLSKEKYTGNASSSLTEARNFSTYTSDFGNDYSRKMCSGFDLVSSSRRGILMDVCNVFNLRRHYFVDAMSTNSKRLSFARNESSLVSGGESDSKLSSKWPKFRGGELDSSDDDEEKEELENRGNDTMKIVTSNAALGKYDTKTKKRVPLKFLEDEDDLSQQVEAIRKVVSERRSMQEDEREMTEEESILSTKRFDECDVSPFTVRALTEAGYVQMTSVQEATLSACLEGKDVMVKARAGTGKSIAFLLPAIETVLKASSGSTVERVPTIYVLILCPTRELASQISAEANVLLKHHDGIGVQSLVGGTRFKVDQRHLESDPCQVYT
ncbi:hypothetical protein RD792_004005 [Penstemon davidsonii]|uniref:DEAD-box ATP-dependent RNA helicase 48 n=1 Tax=Penstemon davidsonii TaxID=160366 RepID=A0ABR0DHM0_9LAMI|nr:hypothetical protein RD792_004005 [Penstemon davidsonii]